MNFSIAKVMPKSLGRAGLKLQKHAPEIGLVVGVVCGVASTVMACKATLEVDEVLAETKENLDKVHRCSEDETLSEKYSPEAAKKDTAIIYAQTGVKLIKLYAPAIGLGLLSVASIVTSHNILRKRNIALAAAYATVDRGFKEYRDRVIDRFGEEIDKELKYNLQAEKIEETVIDKKTGKEKKVKKTVNVLPEGTYSQYARCFDECSSYFEKDPEYNLMFLRSQQQWANDRLISRGHLFLNEVYDSLDIPRSKAGQVVGWVYDPENKNSNGDNYVDFGIYDIYRKTNREFVNGYERAIWLDFNVDGDILSLI